MASRPKTRAYRIVSDRYPPFDGAGTHRWGSRWLSPGRWVVHAAETYSLAVLENLMYWQTTALPPGLLSVTIEIPAGLKQLSITRDQVATAFDDDYSDTRALGDAWYARSETAVLWVPSVVSPFESNVLFNQRHADFAKLEVSDPFPAIVDPRLRNT